MYGIPHVWDTSCRGHKKLIILMSYLWESHSLVISEYITVQTASHVYSITLKKLSHDLLYVFGPAIVFIILHPISVLQIIHI